MAVRDKILQRGIFTIKNQEFNAYIIWNDQNFVREEDIKEYKQTGRVKAQSQQYALIFNDIWKAQQYLYKTPELEGGMVFDLSEQKIWNDFRQKNSQKGINKMILNRCLLDEQHKCALLTLNFCDYKDVKNIKKKLTITEYCPGGYDYEEFLKELNKK
ncbi:MAG TPA: hypothetical protein VJB41_01080 [Patescibacteria group bacterium]|nr:hypothetical protein [Patescibacteria group bacterium]